MVLGALWFSPVVFGKMWMKLMNISPEEMSGGKKGMGKKYFAGFVSHVVMAYVMFWIVGASAVFMNSIGQEMGNVALGAVTGFWIWIGFVATVSLGSVLWEKRPLKLYLLNNAYNLVSFVMMGVIVAIWR